MRGVLYLCRFEEQHSMASFMENVDLKYSVACLPGDVGGGPLAVVGSYII